MKKPARIILVIAVILVALTGAVLFFGTRGMDEMRQAVLPEVSLSLISDGVYPGTSTLDNRWAVSVRVTVKDHQIQSIELIDRKMSNIGPETAEQLNARLINTDTPHFDATTGASLTCKGYMLAVTDALQKAGQ